MVICYFWIIIIILGVLQRTLTLFFQYTEAGRLTHHGVLAQPPVVLESNERSGCVPIPYLLVGVTSALETTKKHKFVN